MRGRDSRLYFQFDRVCRIDMKVEDEFDGYNIIILLHCAKTKGGEKRWMQEEIYKEDIYKFELIC